MINGLNAAGNQFLASIETLQNQMNTAETDLSSGLRVNKASDAPQSVADIFQARADLGNATQVDQNLTLVQAQAQAADSALQSAVQLMDNASSLGLQGSGGSFTAASSTQQATLATQVQGLISQMVSISRTAVDGVYIFSGDQGGSPAYQVDPSSPNGVDRLITTQQATAEASDPTGIKFQVAKTAQDLFDNRDSSDNFTPQNVFASLQNLQNALQGGNSSTIAQAVDGVNTAAAYLNQQLGFYGEAENRISSAITLAQKFQVQAQTQLSNLQDADVPTEALQLTQTTTAMNAAMSAEAKQPTTSLFDYLPQY
jgi:flagellar hook-associated protein 3 FlgL